MELKIDARGLSCPKPVIETKKALDSVSEGNIITIVDNAVARENVSKLARSLNLHFSVTEAGTDYEISIFKGAYAQAPDTPVEQPESLSGTVIFIQGQYMGNGDAALGEILMNGFLYTLTESAPYPRAICLVNSGVYLSTQSEQAIPHLETLISKGTEVFSCGTCLNFYGLENALKIGDVTNMYTIVELLSNASKVITIG